MAIPQIILFADANCAGNHTHVCEPQSFISWFNDITSSFVILEGNRQFFVDANYESQMGPGGGRTLGPGVYNWIEDQGTLGPGTNDKLSSLKPV